MTDREALGRELAEPMTDHAAYEPVLLRLVTQSDLEVFYEHQLDAEATAMAAFPSRDREAFVTHWHRILSDPMVVTRSVIAGRDVAGNVVSWLEGDRREVGYWIGKKYWGRGIATAALKQFLEVVSERPLFASVVLHNRASIHVLEKCGFVPTTDQPDASRDANRHVLFELRD